MCHVITTAMVMAMAMTYFWGKLPDSRSTQLMTSHGEKMQGEEGECMSMAMATAMAMTIAMVMALSLIHI